MSDPVRCWLVDREVDDRGLVSLTYATPDGARARRTQRAASVLRQGEGVTAAAAVDPADLTPVEDPETRERYAAEAERMAARHDPEDPV